jgi:hypothetical protein
MKETTTTEKTYEEEIVSKSDDLIEFEDFVGSEGGSYRIHVRRSTPSTIAGFDEEREIYSFIESFDEDGNINGVDLIDIPEYINFAKKQWEKMDEESRHEPEECKT